WWALGDVEERAAAAVAAVYDRIRRYPLARRPRRVAANVLMDAGADLRRAARRARAADPPASGPTADPHPAVELAAVLADAVDEGIVTAEDAELIAASRIAGTPLADIAARRGAKLRTLQWRRKRAEALLAGAGAGAG